MSSTYAKFATVYDDLMIDIPYDQYVDIVELAVGELKDKSVLDIGCGTGVLSIKFAERGSRVTGVDISGDMLQVARETAVEQGESIEFIEQSMDQLTVNKKYDVAVIAIDSLNYVIEEEAVKATFSRVYEALNVGGVFIFDVHSLFKMDVIFLESPFTYDDGTISYMWHTEEGKHEHSIESHITFFVKQENNCYERFDEQHYQRSFAVRTYIEWLSEVGFTIERIFSDWEDEAPTRESERVFFQVRK